MKKVKWLIISILAVAVWWFVGIIGLLSLIEWGYNLYFGTDEIWFLTGDFTGIPLVLSVLFFGIAVWLFCPFGLLADLYTGEEGLKAGFSGGWKIVIALLSLCAVLLGSACSMSWYERYTVEGVEVCHFGHKKEYTWKEAESFRLKGDYQGILVFEVLMKDGNRYAFNGGIWKQAEYMSTAFDEKFPEDVYDYTVWLAEELAENQVSMDVSGWDQLKKDLYYDSWIELAEEIRSSYERRK